MGATLAVFRHLVVPDAVAERRSTNAPSSRFSLGEASWWAARGCDSGACVLDCDGDEARERSRVGSHMYATADYRPSEG
jgi:hypothetical protein